MTDPSTTQRARAARDVADAKTASSDRTFDMRGTAVRIRRATPSDAKRLDEGYSRLSPETRRLRFFSAGDRLSIGVRTSLTTLDDHHLVLIAERIDDNVGLAVARLVVVPDDSTTASLSIVVVDEAQGQGLGTELLDAVIGLAAEHGITRITGEMLTENVAMHALAKAFHATLNLAPGDATVTELRIDIDSETTKRP